MAIFPLLTHGGTCRSTTAGNADRTVLYDFRRFPAVIWPSGDPPTPCGYKGAGEGCSAPFDPQGKTPRRQRSRLGFRPPSRGPNVSWAAAWGMSSRRPPDHRPSRPSASGRVRGVTGGRRGRRFHRFGAGPPGLRDGLCPSLPPGLSSLPNPGLKEDHTHRLEHLTVLRASRSRRLDETHRGPWHPSPRKTRNGPGG